MDFSGKSDATISRLEADSIWLEYGNRKILQNIYVRVEIGQVVGLLGRNGSGKSSLLEIMYGIRSAQHRSVRINGRYLEKAYQQQGVVAYLPQKQFVPGVVRTGDAFKLYKSDLTKAQLFFPELPDLMNYRIRQLSGGQQRLIETLLILTSTAPFVLLDEPFSNVMPLHVELLIQLLRELKAQKGILITDHYYREVLGVSDKVYLLNAGGRTIQLNDPEQELKDYGYIN